MRRLSAVVLLLALPADAWAWCSEPRPPFRGVPAPPFCAGSTCGSLVVRDYRRSIETYLDDMERYAKAAVAYAECEQAAAIDAWNEFARETRQRD